MRPCGSVLIDLEQWLERALLERFSAGLAISLRRMGARRQGAGGSGGQVGIVGRRRKLLDAIAAWRAGTDAQAPTP
jgi:hypothetical protein